MNFERALARARKGKTICRGTVTLDVVKCDKSCICGGGTFIHLSRDLRGPDIAAEDWEVVKKETKK